MKHSWYEKYENISATKHPSAMELILFFLYAAKNFSIKKLSNHSTNVSVSIITVHIYIISKKILINLVKRKTNVQYALTSETTLSSHLRWDMRQRPTLPGVNTST
jgi:hypothetical protein